MSFPIVGHKFHIECEAFCDTQLTLLHEVLVFHNWVMCVIFNTQLYFTSCFAMCTLSLVGEVYNVQSL